MLTPNLTAILGDKDFYSHFIDEGMETLSLKILLHRCSMKNKDSNPGQMTSRLVFFLISLSCFLKCKVASRYSRNLDKVLQSCLLLGFYKIN